MKNKITPNPSFRNADAAQHILSSLEQVLLEKLAPVVEKSTITIPVPKLPPRKRLQRRLAWRPELHLFYRPSSLSGERMLSYFPPDSDAVVYSLDEWLSDHWDPLAYARSWNPKLTFFEQFQQLLLVVPQPGRAVQNNENCDYVNNTINCKHCYLVAASSNNEHCYYGSGINTSNYCVDCCFIRTCEWCYDTVDCAECYNLQHCWNCSGCRDSFYLHNCRGCRSCFGSVNLVQAEYVFLNEQLSAAEYQRRLNDLQLHTYSGRQKASMLFEESRMRHPYRAFLGDKNDCVSGSSIYNSKNCQNCFECTELEDCANCVWFHQARDSMDCYSWGRTAELCYDSVAVGEGAYHNLFSSHCYSCSEILYCHQCRSCDHCFGCISLRHKSYCIFNKQYSPAEYLALLPQVLHTMARDGEWGEFFPLHISPLFYNHTIANDYFPLNVAEAQELGARWYAGEMTGSINIPRVSPPDSIDDVSSATISTTFACEVSGKPFRVIPIELEFYHRQRIPLPRACFDVRYQRRITGRLPWVMETRSCDCCGQSMKSAFPTGAVENLVCEQCYKSAVSS